MVGLEGSKRTLPGRRHISLILRRGAALRFVIDAIRTLTAPYAG